MLSSSKLTQSVAYLLVCSLLVAGLIRSTTLSVAASMPAESGAQAAPKTGVVDEATKARVNATYNQLPLRFEENRGQTDTQVKYLSRGSASTLFLTKTEAVLTLHRDSNMSVVRMKLQGANRSPLITGEQEMSARTNYFIGNDPQQWQGDVAQYERVRYAEVYPGIDLLYYGQQQSLEYDFEVAPGADPRRIELGFKGIKGLKIERATGDLLLETESGEVRQHKPVVYQEEAGERREVECRYVVKGKRKVGFKLGAYDRTKRLVIDPVLTYSTYLGGLSSELGYGIAVDSSGIAYVTGSTQSNNFPTVNQYQTNLGVEDAFVTKLNTNVSGAAALLYSTYLGGSAFDRSYDIAIDAAGNAYVTGVTSSTNFPVINQYQNDRGADDVFVTKLNTNVSGTASLLYSTYLGSSSDDSGWSIAVDAAGIAYVTGSSKTAFFPTLNQYQTFQGGPSDAFVAKVNTNLSGSASLRYSTYLGGIGPDAGFGIAVDAAGIAYVTGYTWSTNFPTVNQYQTYQGDYDAFVAKVNTNLSGAASLLYSTYLSGSELDWGYGIAIDAAGNAYVTGVTNSTNFPLLNQYQPKQGATDAFVTKLNTNLSGTAALIYSTCLGSSYSDGGRSIAVDSSGNVYVTGYITYSTDFPVLNQYQTYQGAQDAFVAKVNPNLSGTASLLYSTYLGGDREEYSADITLDAAGNVYVMGYTASTNFPVRNPYQQAAQNGYNIFVTKLAVTPPPGDFDADRKTDLALWRPMSGDWEHIRSLDGALITRHWGGSGDRPVPGYYDQDGQTDLAVYRPNEGIWYIFQSFDQSFKTVYLGASTDIPVAADYDGDGRTDAAVYRPNEGLWDIRQSSNNNVVEIQWGISADKPVPADYDRDGKADLAVYRPTDSTWYILQSSNNSLRAVPWGIVGDKPVVGDYDGDEKADVAVWRPTTGTWYALRSSDGNLYAAQWGASSDMPVPGDYDGDGKTDTAVWRPTTGYWYILRSSDGLIIQQQFGSSGDIPVPAAYLPE